MNPRPSPLISAAVLMRPALSAMARRLRPGGNAETALQIIGLDLDSLREWQGPASTRPSSNRAHA